MTAEQAFVAFIEVCLVRDKARRYAELAATRKGKDKLLDALCHEFESAIRSGFASRGGYEVLLNKESFAFHSSLDFGKRFGSVREALAALAEEDSWLILMVDGSAGIFRPEDDWDAEVLIRADQYPSKS